MEADHPSECCPESFDMLPRSLQARLTAGMGVLVLTALGAMGFVFWSALAGRAQALRYERMNGFASRINEAAGYHAIERGIGNTLLNTAGDDAALTHMLADIQHR